MSREPRLSFGRVADAYEANRPVYAETAVDWLFERPPMRDVVDVGAGTGKLTRQLVARGASVIAVEPDPDMRAVFARVLPQVEISDGRGESIPLEDGAVDVVTVGQAFHWFDRDEALPEMRRVTRPGGGFAFLWNQWTATDPILSQFDLLLHPSRHVDEPIDGEIRVFDQRRRMTREQLVGWASSSSAFVTASPESQEQLRAQLHAIVGADEAEVDIATLVVVVDRV